MKDVFLHFAVATHKKEFLYYTVGMLPSSWNFVGVPTSHVFSFFQLSGSCKFFAFEYYTSNSNSKDGASRHHHRAVARRIFKTFLLNLAKGSQKYGASDFHCEIRNPDIL